MLSKMERLSEASREFICPRFEVTSRCTGMLTPLCSSLSIGEEGVCVRFVVVMFSYNVTSAQSDSHQSILLAVGEGLLLIEA